jgi:hypothetical protein
MERPYYLVGAGWEEDAEFRPIELLYNYLFACNPFTLPSHRMDMRPPLS